MVVSNNSIADDSNYSCSHSMSVFLGCIDSIFISVWKFMNSSFFLTIVGTFFAAFAGAYGAQKISEKNKNREYCLKEIRNTNAANMVSFGICNSSLSLKSQHVKPLKENYDEQVISFNNYIAGVQQNNHREQRFFEFEADFKTISLLSQPIELLQKQVFEKISVDGRALSLTTTLLSTMQSLNTSIKRRNDLIESYRKISPLPNDVLVKLYFGRPDADGHTDRNYPDSVESIYNLTDDCIFFSNLLCGDLYKHGNSIKGKYGKNAPLVSEPVFTKAEKANLMPNSDNYADWMNMFISSAEASEQV